MGEAYTAIVDDVYALYYNPAGVLQMDRPEIGTYYSRLFVGLTDNSQIGRMFVGYAQPLGKNGRHGGIGSSYTTLNLPGLYKEETIGLTYGREYLRNWNIGGTVKLLRKSIGTDEYSNNAINPLTGSAVGSADPLLAANRSQSAIGIDLGFQYRMSRAYALGFAARNVNAPDLALGSDKDTAPAVTSVALARKMRTGSLDMEVTNWNSASNNTRFSIGGEHWFKNGFALRAGGGLGSRNYSTLSIGASYRLESIQIDYAGVLPLQGVEGTLGMQQMSLTVRLGKPPVDPLEKQLLKEKEERVRAETEARYAKAETDRLKRQLYELTEAKSKTQRDEEEKAAQRALEEAEAQRNLLNQESSRAADRQRTAFNEYTAALADYNAKVRSGIGLREKRVLLEGILAQFKDRGVDTSTVTRELRSVKSDEAKAKKNFDLSMDFYRRLVQQGANRDERRGMLERIIQKYKDSGIEIRAAEEEMRSLQ